MKYNPLKIIDFSQGIRSAEVMNNDLSLQEQIERERLAIAGSGVNFGLNLNIIDKFTLEVKEGTVIDKDGKEIYVKSKNFDIEKPRLITRRQRVFADEDGRITLSEVPYSTNRTMPSEYANKSEWGIDIYYENDLPKKISIASIDEKILNTNISDVDEPVIVVYNVAYDRIDTVYLNDMYEVDIKSGIDSTTPSSYIPEDCKYILGFVKIISKTYIEETGATEVKTFVLMEFNNRRTVYTDLDNNLYLCGTPFESLLKIYFEEPKEPKEKMIWYDMKTNKFKVWRRTDNFIFTDKYKYESSNPQNPQKFKTSVGYENKEQLHVYRMELKEVDGFTTEIWHKFLEDEIEFFTDLKESEIGTMESTEFRIIPELIRGTTIKYAINRYDGSYYWVPINDTSYMSVKENKMWCPNSDGTQLLEYLPGLNLDEMPLDREHHDLKHFIFRADELHLRFTPYKNELGIIIDQLPLHNDQFSEITVKNILNDPKLTEIAVVDYGYTVKMLQDLNDEYDELGLGFKFTNTLDKPAFIEVNIHHRANVTTPNNKLQRNATFTKTETIIYNDRDSYNKSYHKSERNIVFPTSVPYRYGEEQLEVFLNGKRLKKESIHEISDGENIIGSICRGFGISENSIFQGDEIIYRITNNVYSYDHITSAIEETNIDLRNQIRLLEDEVSKLKEIIDNIVGGR